MHTRAPRRQSLLLGLGLSVAACASAPAPAPVSPSAQAAPPATSPRTPAAPSKDEDKRLLSESATFGDLVRLAQELDSAGEAHSDAGCLLRGGSGLRLGADLSLAARPLPSAPEHPGEALLEQAGSLHVMSSWGPVRGELDTVLLAFTTTSPDAVKVPSVALILTQSGVLVRGSAPELRAQLSALSPDAAGALLSRLPSSATVYVTADRTQPLRSLYGLLRLIPNRHEVALAVALPAGTRLPARVADSPEGLCPRGLPDPAAGEVEGSLSADAIRTAVAPLRDAALSCALSSGGRALLGGRLTLALRVGKEGRATTACVVEDGIGEALLRRCLISAARDLSLPAPSPTGFADLHLPLQIALTGPAAQRASCD